MRRKKWQRAFCSTASLESESERSPFLDFCVRLRSRKEEWKEACGKFKIKIKIRKKSAGAGCALRWCFSQLSKISFDRAARQPTPCRRCDTIPGVLFDTRFYNSRMVNGDLMRHVMKHGVYRRRFIPDSVIFIVLYRWCSSPDAMNQRSIPRSHIPTAIEPHACGEVD